METDICSSKSKLEEAGKSGFRSVVLVKEVVLCREHDMVKVKKNKNNNVTA